jgi:hypothetical protein
MRDWAKNLGVDTNKVHMMADGEGLLHSKLGKWRVIMCQTTGGQVCITVWPGKHCLFTPGSKFSPGWQTQQLQHSKPCC